MSSEFWRASWKDIAAVDAVDFRAEFFLAVQVAEKSIE